MRLSRELFALAKDHPEIEAVSQGLSITTFRYIPPGVDRRADDQRALNALNERLLDALQRSGRAYVSNALVNGRYVLRACIVNFRTDRPDLEALIEAVVDIGRELASAR
jgi:glutamate/tyrosine decarboxylase-like PLP-dependent enzyme